jgi:hypothetical protein
MSRWFYSIKLNKKRIVVNRRDFLNFGKTLAVTTAVSSTMSSPLLASINKKENTNNTSTKDSLFYGSNNFTDEDYKLSKEDYKLTLSILHKLNVVQSIVGYGNFNTISFDEVLKIQMKYSKAPKFTDAEFDYIEKMFYMDPSVFGFYGKRTVYSITNIIPQKEIIKIANSGHFLYKEQAVDTFNNIIKDVKDDIGHPVKLTSGIRNVPKQMRLFFNKIKQTKGDIIKASESLAPPAYSYHSIGDFDVGKIGWGYKNFTARFSFTPEFRAIRKLKYVGIRYTINNRDGVRFEPWHIKLI